MGSVISWFSLLVFPVVHSVSSFRFLWYVVVCFDYSVWLPEARGQVKYMILKETH